MELWIRSQDKRRLIPVKEELNIPYSRTREDFGIFYKGNILAHFKKEKRALEVLDEIQNIIKPTLINTEYHSEIKQGVDKLSFDVVMTPSEDKITYIQPNVVVYEMPKE